MILSIKDLVRQCIIVGKDETTHYGGYGSKSVSQNQRVIVVDLIALQFQKEYNTGRLILIKPNTIKGELDDIIFRNVVGEEKRDHKESSILHLNPTRYVNVSIRLNLKY